MAAYFGKYRGVVVSNEDPSMLGRVQVKVPDVFGDGRTAWAMPCVPAHGGRLGCLVVPAEGASVWVEFERGEPDHPVWSGVWWSSAADVPPTVVASVTSVTIMTDQGHTLTLDDTPGVGGIRLATPTGQQIVINEGGILLSNGHGASVALAGPSVSVNDGALAVT